METVEGLRALDPQARRLQERRPTRSTTTPLRQRARIVHLIETGGETVPPLAVRLAELRQIRGLSQAELAERAGMKQANLSRFENHEDSKISTLEKVVTALGATLSITARFPDGSSWELRF